MLGIAPPRHRANPLQPAMNPLKMAPLREKSHRNFWKPRRGGGGRGAQPGAAPLPAPTGPGGAAPPPSRPPSPCPGGAGEAPAAGIASSRLSPAQPSPTRPGSVPAPSRPYPSERAAEAPPALHHGRRRRHPPRTPRTRAGALRAGAAAAPPAGGLRGEGRGHLEGGGGVMQIRF